jgi:hypothetical protein
MKGNFNGIRLRNITSRKTYSTNHGTVLESFHITEFPDDMETALRLGAPALLVLASGTIQGMIVAFSASIQDGYEITIETTSKPS